MEQLGLPPDVMRKRVEETLDLLGIAELRARPLRTLSGGQQQRVAIGSVLTAHPRVLVLDEPTSALDPTAAEDVLAAVTRLVHDLGVTVVIAEHRLERVVHYADRVVHADRRRPRRRRRARQPCSREHRLAPPVVELGPTAGMDAAAAVGARRAPRARSHCASALADASRRRPAAVSREIGADAALTARASSSRLRPHVSRCASVDLDLHARRGRRVDGTQRLGQVVAAVGDAGLGPRRGHVDVGRDPSTAPRSHVGLVPQTPADLLYLPTVGGRVRAGRRRRWPHPPAHAGRCSIGSTSACRPTPTPATCPKGSGSRSSSRCSSRPRPTVLLLDEPTRGLDPTAKERFSTIVTDLAAAGHAIVIATHDVELVAAVRRSSGRARRRRGGRGRADRGHRRAPRPRSLRRSRRSSPPSRGSRCTRSSTALA